ncbi:hypothetical protein BHE74_00019362 [Ensete ventricosum]|nr:hypothetical protein BHE74_00019362 [Ensete ventricosum]
MRHICTGTCGSHASDSLAILTSRNASPIRCNSKPAVGPDRKDPRFTPGSTLLLLSPVVPQREAPPSYRAVSNTPNSEPYLTLVNLTATAPHRTRRRPHADQLHPRLPSPLSIELSKPYRDCHT